MKKIMAGQKISVNKSAQYLLLFLFLIPVLLIGCRNKETYKKELEQKGIPFTAESFITRAGTANKETMELFIKGGMDVNARGSNGETALMLASVYSNDDALQFLIANGADLNARNNDGYSALMFVASLGGLNELELLIKSGADLNAQNNKGETALMLAALNDKFDAVKLLLDKGANANLRNNRGETALRYAFLNTRIAQLLRGTSGEK